MSLDPLEQYDLQLSLACVVVKRVASGNGQIPRCSVANFRQADYEVVALVEEETQIGVKNVQACSRILRDLIQS